MIMIEEACIVKSMRSFLTKVLLLTFFLNVFVSMRMHGQYGSVEIRGGSGLTFFDALALEANGDFGLGYSWGGALSVKSENRKNELILDLSTSTSPQYVTSRRNNPGFSTYHSRLSMISSSFMLGKSMHKNKWEFGYRFGAGLSLLYNNTDDIDYKGVRRLMLSGVVSINTSYYLTERWSMIIAPRISVYPLVDYFFDYIRYNSLSSIPNLGGVSAMIELGVRRRFSIN